MGPEDPQQAKKEAPNSIVAMFGHDQVKNAVYGSLSATESGKDLSFFFENKSLKPPAYFTTCSCLIIKPHIVADGKVGKIIDTLLTCTFEISAMQMFRLSKAEAE